MRPVVTHRWDLTYHQAVAIQEQLRAKLRPRGSLARAKTVAGIDVSYRRGSSRCFCAVVVMELDDLSVRETALADGEMAFPYVPGLLTFREGPVVIRALANLHARPDVLLCDGQGIAHPRRFGLAAHLGVLFDAPSVGCAKTRLIGEAREPGNEIGGRADLTCEGETIGAVLRTKANVKPVYVSQGHRVSLDAAVDLVLRTGAGYRVPEPTRRAHLAVNAYRRKTTG